MFKRQYSLTSVCFKNKQIYVNICISTAVVSTGRRSALKKVNLFLIITFQVEILFLLLNNIFSKCVSLDCL